jgi:hypothetical protein
MLAVGPYRAPSENSHTAIKVSLRYSLPHTQAPNDFSLPLSHTYPVLCISQSHIFSPLLSFSLPTLQELLKACPFRPAYYSVVCFILGQVRHLFLPCLALPCLALPCLALPCLALPCLVLPCLALPYLTLPLSDQMFSTAV